jgi:hypothetical protein
VDLNLDPATPDETVTPEQQEKAWSDDGIPLHEGDTDLVDSDVVVDEEVEDEAGEEGQPEQEPHAIW